LVNPDPASALATATALTIKPVVTIPTSAAFLPNITASPVIQACRFPMAASPMARAEPKMALREHVGARADAPVNQPISSPVPSDAADDKPCAGCVSGSLCGAWRPPMPAAMADSNETPRPWRYPPVGKMEFCASKDTPILAKRSQILPKGLVITEYCKPL